MELPDTDVTKHPMWPLALCDMCGQPFELEDLNRTAREKGLEFVEERPRFYVYCCYEPTIENNEEYLTVVTLLRRYYGV